MQLVKHINPNAGMIDRMFAWPIAPFDETSHSGMMKTWTKMGQAFRLFDVDKHGRAYPVRNANKRKINLCVDALSSRNFRRCPVKFAKKINGDRHVKICKTHT